ncbi:homoserine O-acetyltransferase [Alteromonas sediminis]|uniref:Probable acyltransferase n=1 Tax=Alteromonas sediminis TaxID=2259342 RepID=A0A3N5Y0E9_9ALTE|nr:homoserine O-acetyltransferase [Alteromonas sediminis]
MTSTRITTLLLLALTALPSWAMIVEKQKHVIPSFTLFNGAELKNVQIGWEAYGELNEDKSNAILINHYFTGSSHAAGKYAESDPAPGYWDAIIGPGKAIDTNRFFVISVDTLANINAYSSNVHTTGPASVNPTTQTPYGLDFPVVTIRDFVNTQRAVLQSLGIKKLHAVIGASMGSMQAIEWASTYPDEVERIVSVIGTGYMDAWSTVELEQWAIPIRLDKQWNQGNYTRETAPLDGLTAALMQVTQIALAPAFINQIGESLDYQPLESGPLHDIRQKHSIVNWLHDRARQRASLMDANHLLYLVRACQLFITGHSDSLEKGLSNITAPVLLLPAEQDLLLMPYMSELLADELAKRNHPVSLHTIEGDQGHLEGVTGIGKMAKTLSTFLNTDVSPENPK